MVKIYLHSDLGAHMKRNEYNLDVKSVSEAVHAINSISKNRFYKYLYDKQKGQAQYQVLINKRPFFSENPITPNNIKEIADSELVMNIRDLKTIDIVPVISGAKDVLGIILGVVLIAVGILTAFETFGAGAYAIPIGISLIVGGIGLLAAGIINLLSSPPKFEDFREIDGSTGRTSYLFNGPENTTQEGGPVPVGYGQLIIGSQVISASYVIDYIDALGNSILTGGSSYVPVLNPDGTAVFTDQIQSPGNRLPIYQEVPNGQFFVFIGGPIGYKYKDLPARTKWTDFRTYSDDGTQNGVFWSIIFGSPSNKYPNLPYDHSIATSKEFWGSPQFNNQTLAYHTHDYITKSGPNDLSSFVMIAEGRIDGPGWIYFYLIPNSKDIRTPTIPSLFVSPNGNYEPDGRVTN